MATRTNHEISGNHLLIHEPSFSLRLRAFRRIAHHFATPGIAALTWREHIYLEQRFSDHAPLVIDYDFTL